MCCTVDDVASCNRMVLKKSEFQTSPLQISLHHPHPSFLLSLLSLMCLAQVRAVFRGVMRLICSSPCDAWKLREPYDACMYVRTYGITVG
mmetsp:Transcript_23903/g.36847  ORF Transcript_23903/g.36847 Transcript_23903/m.36847 type:complete len:90 (+) Transcript_23903:99-368(+)